MSQPQRQEGVQPLKQLALRGCIRHSNLITDVGGLPYDLVEPILKRITARQLVAIEKNCQQIRERSEPLWRRLLAKDFNDRPMPERDYRRTYARYQKEKESQLQESKIRLRENMAKHQKEKEAKKLIQLDSDPIVERRKARQKLSRTAPPGSRSLQQTINSLKAKGSLFSQKNIRFEKTMGGLPEEKKVEPQKAEPHQSKAPHSPTKPQPPHRAARPLPANHPAPNSDSTSVSPIRKRKEPSIFLRPRR